MMTKKEIIEIIVGLGIIIGMVIGTTTYFATAKDLKLVDMRLEQKIVNDNIRDTQQLMWQIENRYPGQPDCTTWSNPADRDQYRRYQQQLEELKLQRENQVKQFKGKG
jgi:hypothetical protein